MRKRLRKKKFVGEFSDMRFQVEIEVQDPEKFLHDFLEYLEGQGLGMISVLLPKSNRILGEVLRVAGDHQCMCDLRSDVMKWVAYRVDDCEVGPLYDGVYGKPFENFFDRIS